MNSNQDSKVKVSLSEVDIIAFGLTKHPNHVERTVLGNFAGHVNAYTYWDIFGDTIDMNSMGQNLLKMMQKAKKIHFNLDGFEEFGTLEEMAQLGTQGIGQGNISNWEYYQIVSNQKFFNKTIFYLDGKPLDGVTPVYGG